MAKYTKDMGPDAIVAGVTKSLKDSASALVLLAQDYREPTARKVARRLEILREGDASINEAIAAFEAWAKDTEATARRAIASDPVGSAAEESRRVANEMRLTRIIESSRAMDEAAGPRLVEVAPGESRAVANASAYDLADRAGQAYLDGNYNDAVVFAEASLALGGPVSAKTHLHNAQVQLYTPAQAKAAAEIESIGTRRAEFNRDLNATVSAVFRGAAEVAAINGEKEEAETYTRAAANASSVSKMSALVLAERDQWGRVKSGTYAEAEGVLPGGVTGTPIRTTDGMAARMTHNLDTGVVS